MIVNNSNYEVIRQYCEYFGLNITRYHSDQALLDGMKQSRKQYRNCDLVILSDDASHKLPIKLASQISRIECVSGAKAKKVFLGYLGQRARAQELGNDYFDAYVTKPINFERLGDTLIELLSPEISLISKDKLNKPMDTSLNILIAEDEDINAMVLSSFLQDAGHQVTRVEDGAQAVDALNKNHFDLVFMDMRMPQMNGLEATRLWRQQEPEGRHIPIIALTDNATIDDRKGCMQIGMDDFITKPISPEQLLDIIRKYYRA
jgi:CheY-like chemotaxis protein